MNRNREEIVVQTVSIGIVFILLSVIVGIMVSCLKVPLEQMKENINIEKQYADNTKTEFTIESTTKLASIVISDNKKIELERKGNSKIGKFFFEETEEQNVREEQTQQFYYFENTKNGIQKRNFKEETGQDIMSDNVYFKIVSEETQPYIETKIKKFKKNELEKKRKELQLEDKMYIINLHAEDLNKLQ